MSKLPVISGKEAVKAMHRAGFAIVRQRGDHIRMEKTTSDGIIKITVPLHETLDRGTLKSIIRSAGLTFLNNPYYLPNIPYHNIRLFTEPGRALSRLLYREYP